MSGNRIRIPGMIFEEKRRSRWQKMQILTTARNAKKNGIYDCTMTVPFIEG
jgi:hypothetical protein